MFSKFVANSVVRTVYIITIAYFTFNSDTKWHVRRFTNVLEELLVINMQEV